MAVAGTAAAAVEAAAGTTRARVPPGRPRLETGVTRAYNGTSAIDPNLSRKGPKRVVRARLPKGYLRMGRHSTGTEKRIPDGG